MKDSPRGFEYATLAFAPLYMLGAGLDILERVGLHRMEAHTQPLAWEMRRAVADLGFDVLTPRPRATTHWSSPFGRSETRKQPARSSSAITST